MTTTGGTSTRACPMAMPPDAAIPVRVLCVAMASGPLQCLQSLRDIVITPEARRKVSSLQIERYFEEHGTMSFAPTPRAIAPRSRSRAEALLTALKLVREEARGAFSVFQE